MDGFIVLALFGFLTGFIFSIPAAGPVMILITSNALKGRLRFCQRVTYGAGIADFLYAFVAVFAFSRLYGLYAPYIPYLLLLGSVFLIALAVKILRSHFDFEHMDDSSLLSDKLRNKGGFRIGLIINFVNPALFAGWLASSFAMLSLAAALGLNTNGLNAQINSTILEMEQNELGRQIEGRTKTIEGVLQHIESRPERPNQPARTANTLISSAVFALFLALGSSVWFYYLARFVVAHRSKLNLSLIRGIIRVLGATLVVLGLYFASTSVAELFFHTKLF